MRYINVRLLLLLLLIQLLKVVCQLSLENVTIGTPCLIAGQWQLGLSGTANFCSPFTEGDNVIERA